MIWELHFVTKLFFNESKVHSKPKTKSGNQHLIQEMIARAMSIFMAIDLSLEENLLPALLVSLNLFLDDKHLTPGCFKIKPTAGYH